jgi:hypothetical protein
MLQINALAFERKKFGREIPIETERFNAKCFPNSISGYDAQEGTEIILDYEVETQKPGILPRDFSGSIRRSSASNFGFEIYREFNDSLEVFEAVRSHSN